MSFDVQAVAELDFVHSCEGRPNYVMVTVHPFQNLAGIIDWRCFRGHRPRAGALEAVEFGSPKPIRGAQPGFKQATNGRPGACGELMQVRQRKILLLTRAYHLATLRPSVRERLLHETYA
jgi:hypothetical protein